MSDPFDKYLAPQPAPPAPASQPEPDPFAAYLDTPQTAESDPFQQYLGADTPSAEEQPVPDMLRREDMQVIADKYGVDVDELRELAPFYGVKQGPESLGEAAAFGVRGVAGAMGRGMLNVPQFIIKKLQKSNMRHALDEMTRMGEKQRAVATVGGIDIPGAEGIAEALVSPGVTVLGRTSSNLARAAEAGAMGAVIGTAGSEEGHELSGALVGTGLGLALGGSIAGVSKLMGKSKPKAGHVPTPSEEAVETVARARGADFQHEVEDEIRGNAPADRIIREQLFGAADELGAAERKILLNTYAPDSAEKLAADAAFRAKHKNLDPDQLLEAAEIRAADNVIRGAANDLVSEANIVVAAGDDVNAAIRKWAGQGDVSGQGTEWGNLQLQSILDRNTAARYIRRNGIADTSPDTKLGYVADRLSDAQNTLRSYDEKWKGIGAEAAHKDINRGINRMSFHREAMREGIRSVFQSLRRTAGLDSAAREAGDIIQRVETETLGEADRKVAQPFMDFFDKQLDEVQKIAKQEGLPPLDIKRKPNYIPVQMADREVLEATTRSRVNLILDDASRISNRKYTDLAQLPDDVYNAVLFKQPEHKSTIHFIRTLAGEASDSPADLSRAYKNMFSGKTFGTRMSTLARAAIEREDVIPNWARETNLYKLADKWTTNTLRHLFLRPGMLKLRNSAKLLKQMGADAQAQYVDDLVQDIAGFRAGTASSFHSDLESGYLQKVDNLLRGTEAGSAKRVALESLRGMPAYLQQTSRNVYQNLLGALNPRAVIQNLTQTLAKTIPELGPGYGPILFLRGMMRTRGKPGAMLQDGLRATIERMEAMGLSPKQATTPVESYLRQGLARTGTGIRTTEAANRLARIGSAPYHWAEAINRAIAFSSGEMMAYDLMKSIPSKQAIAALSRFPTSVQREAQEAITNQSMPDLVKALSTHIVNNTQYQYNRASQAQYARTLGPVFSTFSKWPTATFGQVVGAYRDKGALGATGKLATELAIPWIGLEVVDQLVSALNRGRLPSSLEEAKQNELTDRQKKLMGGAGLSQASPIGSLGAIASGDIFTPPVIDAAVAMFLDPAKAKDTEEGLRKFLEGGANTAYMFAPAGAGGWVRLMTDDLITFYSGERPEGSNFLERTTEGVRRLTK